ncbi:Ankyrin repeat protein [Legionella wadsworthii]|uniref:Ankyrin repeat protein n=1 Tax=Legionella wadsworthii TaxID=28088 RepID=A0A378LVF3_9GAMM|nr:ankyrin repeat domain-containing protein [Legionella wadsworthii]STY29812.1 Ankyrin repeat protein [Legionella wadsworthii]
MYATLSVREIYLTALSNNDISTVEHCLTVNKVSPNIRDKDLNTGLHYAVRFQNKDLLKLLLKHNADISLKNRKGLTAIQLAASNESYDCLSLIADFFLLKHNPKLEATDRNLLEIFHSPQNEQVTSPFIEAVKRGDLTQVKTCLDSGTSVDMIIDSESSTALHQAVKQRDKKLIELLLQYEPNLNLADKKQRIPLQLAVEMEAWECYQLIADYGSKRETSNNNDQANYNLMERDKPKIAKKISPREAYQQAVQQGNIEEINRLLAAKVSVNTVVDAQFNTLLHIGVKTQSLEMVKLAMAYGASINRQNKEGQTALELAFSSQNWSCIEVMAASKDFANQEISQEILKTAVYAKLVNIIKILIDANVSMDYFNTSAGINYLHWLINNNQQDMLAVLGQSPIVQKFLFLDAIKKNDIIFAQELLKQNKSLVDVMDSEFNTILHIGVNTQNLDLIRLALQNGAVSNRKNKQGKTPLELALENRAWNCIKTIVENDPVHNEPLDAALLAALRAHQVELVQILIHAGASMKYFTTLQGKLYFEKLIANKQDEMVAVLSISPVIQELMYSVAISNNEVFVVAGALSKKDVSVDALLGPNKETGLHIAITHKRGDMVQLFLDNHIQLNTRDINQVTAIELALKLQSWDLLKIILEKRPLDKSTWTQYQLVFMQALKVNQPDILMILLKQGMEVLPGYFNTDQGVQDYQQMVAHQSNDMIRVLLSGSKEFRMKFGILPNQVRDYFEEMIMGEELTNPVITKQGTTYNAQDIKKLDHDPITRASLQQNELVPNLIVYDLLAYYKHPHVNLMEVPPCLICPETSDVYKEPVVAGDGFTYEKAWITDYLQKNNNKTPRGHLQLNRPLYKNRLVKILIEEKYSLEKIMEEKNRENYKQAFAERNLKAVEESLKNKVSPNTLIDANGNTGLHKAVEEGSIEFIKLLLDHGASLTMLNKSGLSPMKLAVTCKAWKCIEAMATLHPNDKTMLSQYDIPLIHALHANQIEVARVLLKAGAPMSFFTLEEGEEYFKKLIVTQQKEILNVLITEGRPEIINPLLCKFGNLAFEVEELFEDSISFTSIEEPVIVPTGITYDIKTATTLKTDPLSRLPLSKEDLLPNRLVKDLLMHYKRPGVDVSQIPPCLICQETKGLFINPVVAIDGKTYEESWITKYLAEHDGMTPPTVGAPQGFKQTKNLYSNILVKKLIEENYKNDLQISPAQKNNFSGEYNPRLFGAREEKKDQLSLNNNMEYNNG